MVNLSPPSISPHFDRLNVNKEGIVKNQLFNLNSLGEALDLGVETNGDLTVDLGVEASLIFS